MRNPKRQRFTFWVLCAGLLSVAVATPVRAQVGSTGDGGAAPAQPTAEDSGEVAAEAGEYPIRSLADVDIDALLADTEPASPPADADTAESGGVGIREALFALGTDADWSWKEFRERVEISVGNLVEAARNRLPEGGRRFIDELAASPLLGDLQNTLLPSSASSRCA
jgi:hypothetical protein